MIKETDLLNYETGVAVSYAAKYNKMYSQFTSINVEIAEKAIPILESLLDLPDRFWVRVCPIKQKGTHGRYYNLHKLAEVDCRLNPISFLKALCHELIHAEQYKQDKLVSKLESNKKTVKWVNYWEGTLVNVEYRNQLWEIDAFTRQETLALEVMKRIPECFKDKQYFNMV